MTYLDLQDHGYLLHKKTEKRRMVLEKLITSRSFDIVLNSLMEAYSEKEGYRKDRVKVDCRYLIQELKAGKYVSREYEVDTLRKHFYDSEVEA